MCIVKLDKRNELDRNSLRFGHAFTSLLHLCRKYYAKMSFNFQSVLLCKYP